MKANLILLAGVALGLTLGSAALADPNLKPKFNAKTGTVAVTNIGADATLVPTYATVDCTALNGDACPDPAPADAVPYTNAAFPNKATIVIPPLNPGKGHKHTIAFFDTLVFLPGKYVFTVCADAGNDVEESSERDNCVTVGKLVLGKVSRPGGLSGNTVVK